jgi:predicted RNase H-like HicB family nuclease
VTYRFAAVITKEDDWYVARCPELSVTSQGETPEAARANLQEAVELYIESWGVPEGTKSEDQPFVTFVKISA